MRADACGHPVRVVFCVDNMGIGGTELNAVRTAEQLDRSRFSLSVACLQSDGPLRERYVAAGVPVHSFPIDNLYGWSAAREGLRLARFLALGRTDVVHCHDIYSNIFGTSWARLAGTPAIIASQRWSHDLPRRAHRIGNRLAYRLAHRVLANSPTVAHSLISVQGVRSDRVVVIPNFVDDAEFVPLDAAGRHQLLSELGVPRQSLVVGSVARLALVKDHASLLRAVALLTQEWTTLHLVLVGDGEQRPALEELARSLRIEGRVHFAGTRPRLPNLHHLFDLSVLCSRSEGFPNSIIEAMAAGKPVIATEVGGNVDAVAHEQTGLLVPPGRPDALALAMKALLSDGAKRAVFGDAGRQRARESYHARAVVSDLEQLYHEMVTGRTRSTRPTEALVRSTANVRQPADR